MAMIRRATSLVIVCLCISLTGCITVGPDYEPPEIIVPDAWHEAALEGLDTGDAYLAQWWSVFDDSVLNGLIERVESDNLSLAAAATRLDEARMLLAISRGEKVPSVDGFGTIQRTRASESVSPSLPSGVSRTDTFYQVGVDAGWELDLWGRIRRNIESAEASYAASMEDYRDVLVSVYAEVALSYISARNLQERISLAEENVTAQRESVELTRNRYEAGLVGMLDVRQAELNLATTESLVPQLRAGYIQSVNRLGVLMGEYPNALHGELAAKGLTPSASLSVTKHLPTDLLRQRPDVRAAERRLAGQTARIGAQQALLYPTFALGGTFALEAFESGDAFDGDSRTYGFGPAFRWNLFDGKRIRNSVYIEEIRTERALIAYERRILVAVEEVENAMVALAQEEDRKALLATAMLAAQQSVELVQTLYRTGLTDFQNVLDMERAKFLQDDAYAVSKGEQARNLVQLYKALGGGWSPNSEETN
ncbi:MAG: efflux transporter outer membrane subunit [Candidatus Hydrogenedentota bacterium]